MKKQDKPKANPRLISYIGNADNVGGKKPKPDLALISYVTKGYIPRWAIWMIGLIFLFVFLVILFS